MEQDTRQVFKKLGSCSHTLFYQVNREFGDPKEFEGIATNLFAGGLLQTGHQCGMLWGSAMAAGTESYRRHNNSSQAIAVAINATRQLMQSFFDRTKTHNCSEVTGCNLKSPLGIAKFTVKSLFYLLAEKTGKKVEGSCFILAERWAPEAINAAIKGLSNHQGKKHKPAMSCASEVVKKMGGSDEEIVMVAGFAGGLGLSGNACGALSAAIWMKLLDWCRKNPGKNPPYFNNREVKKTINTFYQATDSKILCHEICGQCFKSVDDHSNFIENGGCAKLILALAQV